MTAMIVFAALIVANIAYSIYDNRQAEIESQMDDFMRVEYKKTYNATEQTNAAGMWL